MIEELRWIISYRLIKLLLWVMPPGEQRRLFAVAIVHWTSCSLKMLNGASAKQAVMDELNK